MATATRPRTAFQHKHTETALRKKESLPVCARLWIRVCVCVFLLRDALTTVQMISAVVLKGQQQPECTVGSTTNTALNEQPC